MNCECQDPVHDDGCPNAPMEFKAVRVSPTLCAPCLFGCNYKGAGLISNPTEGSHK